MKQIDLTGFHPIPALPAYLVHPDGRVVSLKKERPRQLTVNKRSFNPDRWTVKLAGRRLRVSQLLFTMFGTSEEFTEAAREEIEEHTHHLDDPPESILWLGARDYEG